MSSIGADIAWARAEQDKLFLSRSRVTRGSGAPGAFDEDTGLYGAASAPVVYEGRCSIRWALRRSGLEVRSGERELRFESLEGKYPPDTPILKNDMVEVLDSPLDAGLEGRMFRVEAVHFDERQIARVCELEEVEL